MVEFGLWKIPNSLWLMGHGLAALSCQTFSPPQSASSCASNGLSGAHHRLQTEHHLFSKGSFLSMLFTIMSEPFQSGCSLLILVSFVVCFCSSPFWTFASCSIPWTWPGLPSDLECFMFSSSHDYPCYVSWTHCFLQVVIDVRTLWLPSPCHMSHLFILSPCLCPPISLLIPCTPDS